MTTTTLPRKTGPRPRPWVNVKTAITPELDGLLNQLVQSTGISKAALIRDALAKYAEDLGYLPAGTAGAISPTRTGGLGVAPTRKEH